MAARKAVPSLEQQERTRAAIQTTQLIKRLQHFALGIPEPNAQDGSPPAEIDANRLRAIEILLRKSLPDLQSVAITGTGENGELMIGGKVVWEVIHQTPTDR